MKITYKEYIHNKQLPDTLHSYIKFLEDCDEFYWYMTEAGKKQYADTNFPHRFNRFGGYGYISED